ncbi:MAG: hypothetical protein Q9210_001065 [Variospora velana]
MAASNPSCPSRKARQGNPSQHAVEKLWTMVTTEYPGKLYKVLPDSSYTRRKNHSAYQEANAQKNVTVSYEEAVAACKSKVHRISQDCRQSNQKFVDLQFDIEKDLSQWRSRKTIEDCLIPLGHFRDIDYADYELRPFSVKRVEQIFDNPRFYTDDMTANAVHQGRNGDCWLMSAIIALSNNKGLLDKICVAMDEKVGVYGFVFYRDGEWIHEVIDDKLYLAKEDFHESSTERGNWAAATDLEDPDERYRKAMQTGSIALNFARCRNDNETWLPLLEKAYAKAHGDYGSIDGGWVGEALEDLTGGVTSELFTADVFDKDEFWTNQLMNVNKQFLFGMTQMGGRHGERKGIVEKHAYSIMQATELKEGPKIFRLLKIRNPWGTKEWEGPWSNGSKEWTGDRLKTLNHQFGDGGVFWISYEDFLKHFQHIDRTQLFGADWTVTQRWTCANVPWSDRYLEDTWFVLRVTKAGRVVIALCQLDDRYFLGLKGLYDFQLQFCIKQDGNPEFIKHNRTAYFMSRSVTTELDLDAGNYSVMIKITASRKPLGTKAEKVVIQNFVSRPEKLRSVGLRYDTAHAKGGFEQKEKEYKQRLQIERRAERREKRKFEAKKAFEVRKRANRQEKLKRLRATPKGKDVKSPAVESDRDPDAVVIHIVRGKATSRRTDRRDVSDCVCGRIDGKPTPSSKQMRVVVETPGTPPSRIEKAKPRTQSPTRTDTKSGEVPKQAQEDTRRKTASSQDREEHKIQSAAIASSSDKKARKQRLCTLLGVQLPSRSIATIVKNTSKAEEQPSGGPDQFAITIETNPNSSAPTHEAETPKEAHASPPDVGRSLTLSDISDDGLSCRAMSMRHPTAEALQTRSQIQTLNLPKPDTDDVVPAEAAAHKKKNIIAEEESDPWNPVCVFGLRVYSLGSQVEVDVVIKKMV